MAEWQKAVGLAHQWKTDKKLFPNLIAQFILSLRLADRDRGTNSLSASVAEESGEMADAGADVDEAVAVGGGGGEDVRDGGHADQLVLLLRLHVLPEHVPKAPLKCGSARLPRNRRTT